MALTIDILKANALTASLTDEQLNSVVELSRNDEASVIGQRVGEIYGGLDADVLAASGIGKEGTEKTYDYTKRVIQLLREKAEGVPALQTKVGELEKEKARLEGVIAKGGGDAETRRQLEQARADLANVTKDYTELKTRFDDAEAAHEKAMFDVKIDGEMARATAGIKFKPGLPPSVTAVLMQQAVAKVKGMHPEYIDDGNGGKVLAFMDNGTPMRNKENSLRPYTADELIARELQAMGVLEAGRKQTGTGLGDMPTTPPAGAVDISGARTQSEAHEIIAKQLMAQGKVNGSRDFAEAMAAAWKANIAVIKALPLQ